MQIMKAEKLTNWMFIYFVFFFSRLSGMEKDFAMRNVDIQLTAIVSYKNQAKRQDTKMIDKRS